MIIMAAVYVAGIISGIVLVVIALAGWVRRASIQLKERNEYAAAPPPGRAIASPTSLADHRSNRHRRRRRPDPFAA